MYSSRGDLQTQGVIPASTVYHAPVTTTLPSLDNTASTKIHRVTTQVASPYNNYPYEVLNAPVVSHENNLVRAACFFFVPCNVSVKSTCLPFSCNFHSFPIANLQLVHNLDEWSRGAPLTAGSELASELLSAQIGGSVSLLFRDG